MDLVLTNVNGEEKEFPVEFDIDIEIGKDTKNDFEYTISTEEFNEEVHSTGCRVFIPGTEYGGVIKRREPKGSGDTILAGKTWRGILTKQIIKPPAGKDYLVVGGEANQVIASLISGRFGSLIQVSSKNSTIQIQNHQVNRHVTVLDGIEEMLGNVGARLDIAYDRGEPNESGHVLLSAVPIKDYSDDVEISEDINMKFDISENCEGVNHLICLGQGDLSERTVLDIYVQEDGSIGTEQFYFGEELNEEVYDFKNVESEEELRKGGIKRLKESMDSVKITPYMDTDLDIAIGDIVGGRERTTGIVAKVPIVRKVITIRDGAEDIKYDLKGERNEDT